MAKSDTKKVKILTHAAAGKYLIAANYGQEIELEKKQADLVVKNKDGEYVSASKTPEKTRLEILKDMKRADLDDLAKTLELNPEDYKKIDAIAEAIEEKEKEKAK